MPHDTALERTIGDCASLIKWPMTRRYRDCINPDDVALGDSCTSSDEEDLEPSLAEKIWANPEIWAKMMNGVPPKGNAAVAVSDLNAVIEEAQARSYEVRELMGPHEKYHRARDNALPSGVNVEFVDLPLPPPRPNNLTPDQLDALDELPTILFKRFNERKVECSRWDADAVMKKTQVYVVDLVDSIATKLNWGLHWHALKLEAADDGLVVSNRGGYHSKPDAIQKLSDEGSPEAKTLMGIVHYCVMTARMLSCASGNEKAAEPTTAWINVCRDGDAHGLHSHEPAVYSAVYYVSVPESKWEEKVPFLSNMINVDGHLVLRLASGGSEGDTKLGLEGDRWCVWDNVKPKEGRLVIFPSWMPHGVLKVDTAADDDDDEDEDEDEDEEKPRISIAFNTGEENVNLKKYEKKKKAESKDGRGTEAKKKRKKTK